VPEIKNEFVVIEIGDAGYVFINGSGVTPLRLTATSQGNEIRPLARYYAKNQPPGVFTKLTVLAIYVPQ